MSRTKSDALEIETWIVDYLTRLVPEGQEIDGDTPILSIGIDSIEAVDLTVALEDWLGMDVDPEAAFEHVTVGALARALVGGEAADKTLPPVAVQAGADDGHAFSRAMNPALAELLEALHLDKRFVRGEGSALFDSQGRRVLDFVAAYGALPFGHNPPAIWRALSAMQARQEPCFVQPSLLDPAGELAERLLEIAPAGMTNVTFANSGAEAVEAAIKMCRMATGRLGIASTEGGFHGKTLAALSATGTARYQKGTGAPAGGFAKVPYGDAEALRDLFQRRPGEFAAFVVEPIQGEGGVVVPSPGYLGAVRAICDAAGVLLVFDEVQTGLGRTGSWFGCDHEGVVPDALTVAKALGGGLVPIAAVISSAAAWSDDFGLQHSSTFAGGGLACRAGLAVLDELAKDDEALIQRAAAIGARFQERLRSVAARFPHLVSEVRGRGLLMGLRLAGGLHTWPSSLLGITAEAGGLAPLFASYLLNVEGVRVAPTLSGNDVVRIEPPLNVSWQECEEALGAIEEALLAFASGDSARVIGSIRHRRALPPTLDASPVPARGAPMAPRSGDARFAFLVHPLGLRSYADYDASLAALPEGELLASAAFAHRLATEPMVVSQTRVTSRDGSTAFGEFILVGHTASELAAMPRQQAIAAIREAVQLARSRGAQLVGLGAFTSIVTQGGYALRDQGVALTSGNSYTVAAALDALDAVGEGLSETTAVLGAGGAIGRAVVANLLARCKRLHLVGNPARSADQLRDQLMQVAAEAYEHLLAGEDEIPAGSLAARIIEDQERPRRDASRREVLAFLASFALRDGGLRLGSDAAVAARAADVLITATSATGALVAAEDLRRGAVVCEISRPYNLGDAIRRERPDVQVIEAGVIELPHREAIGSFGLPEGHSYACMAEAMILALAGREGHASLGTRLSLEEVEEVGRLARVHGFAPTVPERADANAATRFSFDGPRRNESGALR
jgi:acetylornithine/succinyldiaminopimelate/putrescine aminotransferase/predicted amino acid dehydrogenase/acyl carrier protein